MSKNKENHEPGYAAAGEAHGILDEIEPGSADLDVLFEKVERAAFLGETRSLPGQAVPREDLRRRDEGAQGDRKSCRPSRRPRLSRRPGLAARRLAGGPKD